MCPRAAPRVNDCSASFALHERYADESGFVTLVYDTEVFCSTRL
jgi:hypothetical protein